MRRRDFLRSAALALAVSRVDRTRAAAAQAQVLIAGGGFGGAGCALALRRLNPDLRVTVIDPSATYVTCPMSNAVIAGMRSLGFISLSRTGLAGAGVQYVRDRVAAIDAQARAVRLAGGGLLRYDRLIVAPGIRLLYGQPEGYDAAAALHMPHAWEAGAQTRLLRERLERVPDGGTVAISVPAGLMRCPPGPYERASLIANYLKQRRARCKVLIFDSNNHFPRQDLFTQVWADLYPGMIEWIAPGDGGALTRVDAAAGVLHSAAGAQRVSLASIIPPQAPGLLALESGLSAGHGWCPVRPRTFESQLLEHVYVLGDACIAGAMPKSASAAASQARQCAAAVCASLAGREPAAPALDSVCYSLLSAARALAIHGTFALSEGELVSAPRAADDAAQPSTSVAAQEALGWYAQIRAQCFAA
jgi:NADPH-dependent 2,4-dienoyl-CoA reductase/sulfur reductase-like enzyme